MGEVGEWLDRGLGVGLRGWDKEEDAEEEVWLTELQGWQGGGLVGLGGAGACFLVPAGWRWNYMKIKLGFHILFFIVIL